MNDVRWLWSGGLGREKGTYLVLACLGFLGLCTCSVQVLSRRSHLSHLDPGVSDWREHFALAAAHWAQAVPHLVVGIGDLDLFIVVDAAVNTFRRSSLIVLIVHWVVANEDFVDVVAVALFDKLRLDHPPTIS